MVTPFMIGSLVILPKAISYMVLIGLVVAGIYEFRHSFIGRVGIFLNSMLLWQIFYESFSTLPIWFQWYLNIGTIVGIIALGSYLFGRSLPTQFYQVCFLAYGSFSVIFAVGLAFMNFFQPSSVTNITTNVTQNISG